MSSWQPDSPVERADGTLCCKAHHLVWCGKCCVDYTFMQEDSEEEEDEDEDISSLPLAPSVVVGPPRPRTDATETLFSGLAVHDQSLPSPITHITRFSPPKDTDTPQTLFIEGRRFIRRSKRDQILIYTDGACVNNGQPLATAGCAFVFRLSSSTPAVDGTVSFHLERQGPSGIVYAQSSNRAELRAVIAALQFRAWHGEGWTELVIATDSEYVVSGATQWVQGWARNGWMTSKNTPVKNRDLWELLLQEIRTARLRVLFWRIPRQWNLLADQGAKAAAGKDAPTKFTRIIGALV